MALVDEIPYRPWAQRGQVVDGRFRWRLGLRPLDLDGWFEWGTDGDDWVAEKADVMAAHGDIAYAALDDVDAEAHEAAEAIAAHCNADLDPSLHPLDAAARLVPDDLVLLVERGGRLVFGAGSVCFPNRWDLRSKIGSTMAETHAPVAELNDQLAPAIDAFFERLTPARAYWRLGWGLLDSPHGFEPPNRPVRPGTIPIGAVGSGSRRAVTAADDEAFVRVERETLRRFPVTRCILFTIRTYICRLDALPDTDRSLVASAISAMSPPVRGYKDVTA